MAKTLQDRIKDLDEYRPNITYKDGAFILKITFKSGWNILEPENDLVAHAKDKKTPGLNLYVSTIENTDEIFNLIDETIAVNKEMERKLILYKQKVLELQELFLSDITYDKLISLRFVYDEPSQSKRGRKPKKTAENAKTEEEANNCQQTEENAVSEVLMPTETVSEQSDIDKKISEVIG